MPSCALLTGQVAGGDEEAALAAERMRPEQAITPEPDS
jgi:hypothetical protein